MRAEFISEENRLENAGRTGQYLSAEDVGQMVALIKELRDVTQSRKSFAAANDFLGRFTSDEVAPELVHDPAFEH